MALSVCRCQAQVGKRQCRTIDERNIMVLLVYRCWLWICDNWDIYTFTTSVRRRIEGTQKASGCCFQPSLLYFRLFLFLFCCWWSVVGCWCWLPIVTVGGSWMLLVIDCRVVTVDCRWSLFVHWLSGAGSRVLNVCISYRLVFPLSMPTSDLIQVLNGSRRYWLLGSGQLTGPAYLVFCRLYLFSPSHHDVFGSYLSSLYS